MKDWRDFYRGIELNADELEAAILEGKIKKYFYEKNKDYWQEREKGKGVPTMLLSNDPTEDSSGRSVQTKKGNL